MLSNVERKTCTRYISNCEYIFMRDDEEKINKDCTHNIVCNNLHENICTNAAIKYT